MSPEGIAEQLRAELLAGKIKPGAPLPQEDLAARFAVSRIPVRDALRILSAEGLVNMTPNRGANVITLSRHDVRELYELRVLLECDCLERAARAVTDDKLAEIDRVRKRADLDAGTPNWAIGDWAFHEALYRIAGRQRQVALIHALRQTCQIFVGSYGTLTTKRPRWLSEHKLIVDHLRQGEPDLAVSVLRRHIEAAGGHLLSRMPKE